MAGKTRVHELAKEFGVTSREVLAAMADMGEYVKSASSPVESPIVKRLRERYVMQNSQGFVRASNDPQSARHVSSADRQESFVDNDRMVLNKYPFPVAYRWREVEASMSAGVSAVAYQAILETAEVLLCYAANLTLAFAREAAIELGYLKNISMKIKSGRGGLGFGDWVAILEEVRDSRAFQKLPDFQPLAQFRSFLANAETNAARQRLSRRRNDQAHLRRVDPTDLPHAVEIALADLTTLMRSAGYLSNISLVHITKVEWDTLENHALVHYRELMGDHPVVRTRTILYRRSDLEVGSLYILDRRGIFHLLRPFLVGRLCPTCRNWSTFHVDGTSHAGVTLKSLEHGHTYVDESVAHALRRVYIL